MTNKELANEIFKRYGAVTRCRGHFIYTKKGVRLTDLYRENGRAVLGWKTSAFTRFKDVLGRGITGTFFCEQGSNYQLCKAASAFAKKNVKAFYIKESDAASLEGKVETLVPPLAWASDIIIAYTGADQDSSLIESLEKLSVVLPSPLSAAIIRGIYDFVDALKTLQEKDFFLYDTVLNPYFVRQGMVLTPKITDAALYDQFVLFCLDNGLVINPCVNGKSLVPFGVDKGVFTKLKNADGGKYL